jgi:hypothetical protein
MSPYLAHFTLNYSSHSQLVRCFETHLEFPLWSFLAPFILSKYVNASDNWKPYADQLDFPFLHLEVGAWFVPAANGYWYRLAFSCPVCSEYVISLFMLLSWCNYLSAAISMWRGDHGSCRTSSTAVNILITDKLHPFSYCIWRFDFFLSAWILGYADMYNFCMWIFLSILHKVIETASSQLQLTRHVRMRGRSLCRLEGWV